VWRKRERGRKGERIIADFLFVSLHLILSGVNTLVK